MRVDGSQPRRGSTCTHVVPGGQERTGHEPEGLLQAASLRLDRVIETGSHGQIIEASRA